MRFDWLKARQTKYSGYVVLYLVVILAVLTLANWLANRHNKSLDTTANKRFSLSDQTEKVVKNLQQDVKVTLYDRSDRFAAAKDLLSRYDNLSAKLTVDYIDPYKKPQIARAAGIKTEGTVFVESGARKEEVRSLTEQDLTGAIIGVLKSGVRTVCFVSGSGEHSLEESGPRGYSNIKELLEKNNYQTRAISLLEKAEVPADCTALVVGGPRFEYPEPQVEAVKKYVEGGGSALFLVDPPLQMGREDVSPNPKLAALLESWGVTLDQNLVLDTSGVGQIFGLGPEVPLVSNYDSHAIVREMKESATGLALSRSLETKNTDQTTVEKLFSTSENSYATSNLSASPIQLNPAKDKKGPFALAAAGTYRTGQEGKQGRFVVVGSSDWAANYILRFQGNRDLFLNMANWLSSDEDLIAIRPKEPEDRRLTLNRSQMNLVRYTSQFGLPLLIIVGGVAVWWRRR